VGGSTAAKLDAARHIRAIQLPLLPSCNAFEAVADSWHDNCFIPSKSKHTRGTAMNFDDATISGNTTSSDFTLLEGLYQLAVTGHTDDWEFERLNNAVYERLLSSYNGGVDMSMHAAANPMNLVE
jgi:hypothetical protein